MFSTTTKLLALLALLALAPLADAQASAEFVARHTRGTAPLAVDFRNRSTDADFYSWWFGDGEQSSEEHPMHVFEQPGTYTVTLIAVSLTDGTDTEVKTDFVVVATPRDMSAVDLSAATDTAANDHAAQGQAPAGSLPREPATEPRVRTTTRRSASRRATTSASAS